MPGGGSPDAMMMQTVPTSSSSSMKDHRNQLHLHNLNGGVSSFSTRVTSGNSPTSSETSSAMFPNSPTSNNNNQSTSSTSFKFNLLNTVRKAFKKNSLSEQSGKDASHLGSQTNLNKIINGSGGSGSSSTKAGTPQTPPYTTNHFESEHSVLKAQQGRNRSSTYDASSSPQSSALFKQHFKQLQQDALPRQNENVGHKIAGRKLFKSEKVGKN